MEPLDLRDKPMPTDKVPGHHWDPYKGKFVPNLTDEELAHMWPNATKQQRRHEAAVLTDRGELTSPPTRMLSDQDLAANRAPTQAEVEADTETALADFADALEAGRKPDNVVLPTHYARFKIEPIRFCIENGLNGFQFNIVKYILRHDAKNGLEDLRKAQRYLTMFIRFQEGDPDWWRA